MLSRLRLPAGQLKPAVQSMVQEIRTIPVVQATAGTTQVLMHR